jgi:purine-nucleoside phosphorylase
MRSKVGVVLGSGLDAFAEVLENRVETAYAQIAGWPISTVSGHAGKLVEGRIGRTDVVVLVGRAHLYEGYTARQITFGVRELGRRGVEGLVLTNAAGAINLNWGSRASRTWPLAYFRAS